MPVIRLSPPTPGPLDFFTRCRLGPVTVVFVLLSAGWYLWAVRRTRRNGRAWPGGRTASFMAGEVAYVLALLSGLHTFAPQNFSAYGTEYILAVLVAPLLWAFGAPLQLLLRSSEGTTRDRILRAVEHPVFQLATNLFVTWLVFVGLTCGLFFSGWLRSTMDHPLVADPVFLVLALAGFLFYWPVVDVDPLPRRIGTWPRVLYLLLAFPIWSIVGMGMESQTNQVSPALSLASLHVGAAVIWVAGESVDILGAVWVLWQWLRRDLSLAKEHDQEHEAAAARQLALWRASRDAAARSS